MNKIQERKRKYGPPYFRNSLSTQKPQIQDNLSQDRLGFTRKGDFSFHPFSHGHEVAVILEGSECFQSSSRRTVWAGSIRQSAHLQHLSGCELGTEETHHSIWPQRAHQLWGNDAKSEFGKKSSLLLWVTHVPCSAGTQGNEWPAVGMESSAGTARTR